MNFKENHDLDIFTCPVCGEKQGADKAPLLHFDERTARCPEGHCFDVSAKGYLNLLLSQHKNVKDPGDSKEMVAARREFLDSGAYRPLLTGLCRAASELTEGLEQPLIADCGCGEGYYTAGIYDHLAAEGKAPLICAVDISKNALSAMRARTRGKAVSAAVASVFRLPLATSSADMATVIFAPFQTEELRRVLKNGGTVVTAIPAEKHLYGLKQVLYDEPRLNTVKPYEIDGFDFLGKDEVSFTLTLDSQAQLNALFMMTPYYYKTSPADSDKVYGYFGTHDLFTTDAAFEILKYKVRK